MAFTPVPADGFVLDQELSDIEESRPMPSKQTFVNQHVMRKIKAALELDPECDILSIIPASYKSKVTKQSTPPSAIARLNRTIIDELQSLTNESPEIDLLSHFPKDYRIKYDRGMEDPIVYIEQNEIDGRTELRLEYPNLCVFGDTPS